ncbi:hypothetical protein UPYG_G00224590 [Umbra pygmaea]|uniref:Uncharacterized protein n=1 Tax=Umbra pygmaea TaxID=75934 RepID=A0ABD0WDW6_UMBPY
MSEGPGGLDTPGDLSTTREGYMAFTRGIPTPANTHACLKGPARYHETTLTVLIKALPMGNVIHCKQPQCLLPWSEIKKYSC